MDFQEFIKNKANELVSLDWTDDMILSFIDGAEQVKNYFGWHPASELPPLDEKKNSKPVIAICGIPDPLNYGRVLPRFSAVVGGRWIDKDVKWWCYPPKEEEE